MSCCGWVSACVLCGACCMCGACVGLCSCVACVAGAAAAVGPPPRAGGGRSLLTHGSWLMAPPHAAVVNKLSLSISQQPKVKRSRPNSNVVGEREPGPVGERTRRRSPRSEKGVSRNDRNPRAWRMPSGWTK
jgi:hypothetical protein